MTALEAHENRFKQLESLPSDLKQKKIVVSSYDLAAVENFKLDLEYQFLLEKEKGAISERGRVGHPGCSPFGDSGW